MGKLKSLLYRIRGEVSTEDLIKLGLKVGKNFKNNFDIVEAFDMTLEATVTKTMWLLAHPELDFSENFYRTINHDVLFA